MSSSVNLKKFQIPLEEIHRATENGYWRFNDFYEEALSECWPNRRAFIKRYKKERYESQELEIVSRLHHEDIISFIGYCDEDDTHVYTVYEYFDSKSLYSILARDGDNLKWAERLEICIRVTEVLNYLHSGVGSTVE